MVDDIDIAVIGEVIGSAEEMFDDGEYWDCIIHSNKYIPLGEYKVIVIDENGVAAYKEVDSKAKRYEFKDICG